MVGLGLLAGLRVIGQAAGGDPGDGDGDDGQNGGDDGQNGDGDGDGTPQEVTCTVRSASTTGLDYQMQVDSEPVVLTAPDVPEGDKGGDSGDTITPRGDGTWDVSGRTGSAAGDQAFGDSYGWTTSGDTFGILGWEASLADTAYEIEINGDIVAPSQFPAYQPPSDGGNGGTEPPEGSVPLGGGPGYEHAVTESDATTVVTTRSAFEDALNTANAGDVIFIPGSEVIDLGSTDYTLPDGVTIASDRGVDGSPGALISSDPQSDWNTSLYLKAGDNVRVSGLRYEGPFPDRRGGGSGKAGVVAMGDNIEVDNCELYGFSEGAVWMFQGDGEVHHNYIHDNNTGGFGYGVACSEGHSIIEYNYFNRNRHSTEADGSSDDGYICRFNHQGPETWHHVFDVHEPANNDYHFHNNISESLNDVDDGQDTGAVGGWDGSPGGSIVIEDNWWWQPNAYEESDVGVSGVTLRNNALGQDAPVSFGDIIPGHPGAGHRPWD